MSLATIRKRLGHKHIQTTLRYAEQSELRPMRSYVRDAGGCSSARG